MITTPSRPSSTGRGRGNAPKSTHPQVRLPATCAREKPTGRWVQNMLRPTALIKWYGGLTSRKSASFIESQEPRFCRLCRRGRPCAYARLQPETLLWALANLQRSVDLDKEIPEVGGYAFVYGVDEFSTLPAPRFDLIVQLYSRGREALNRRCSSVSDDIVKFVYLPHERAAPGHIHSAPPFETLGHPAPIASRPVFSAHTAVAMCPIGFTGLGKQMFVTMVF